MTDDLLFKGLKVVDVASWIAGPVAATMLADFGADVIKIEQPGVGDAYRGYSFLPGLPSSEHNYCWLLDSRNKRSLSLNLKTEQGRAILHQLVKQCDVYVTNQPMAMRRAFGLTYEDLRPLNPRMIYASLTAYGETGPEQDREGFDIVAYWSRSGLMDLVRSEGALPAFSLPGMGDHPTAVAMYASIVTGLLRRAQTGEGSMVHTSLFANGLWSAGCLAQAQLVHADFSPYRVPNRMFLQKALCETADGRLLQFSMIRTTEEMDALMAAIGAIELLVDERFDTPEKRVENGHEFVGLLRPVFKQKTAKEWMTLFFAERIPVVLVGKLEDLETDPQLLLNDIIVKPAEDGVAPGFVINHPVKVQGLKQIGPKKAPANGEHSAEVLRELGYSDAAIDSMRASGVI